MTRSEIFPEQAGPAARGGVSEQIAFTDLLQRCSWRAFRFAQSYRLSPDDAADCVQDACLAAWRARNTRRGPFEPWFMAIVARLAGRRKRVHSLTFWQPEPVFEWPEGYPELKAALRRMPTRYRVVLHLRYGEDMKVIAVAQTIGLSPEATKQLIYRARNRLRQLLSEEDSSA